MQELIQPDPRRASWVLELFPDETRNLCSSWIALLVEHVQLAAEEKSLERTHARQGMLYLPALTLLFLAGEILLGIESTLLVLLGLVLTDLSKRIPAPPSLVREQVNLWRRS
jgi:hypothetical protein